jgi:hypothetical protein
VLERLIASSSFSGSPFSSLLLSCSIFSAFRPKNSGQLDAY